MNTRYERDVFLESARMQLRLVSRVPFNYVPSALQPATLLFLSRAALLSAPQGRVDESLQAIGLLSVWGSVVFSCGMFLHWDVLTGVLPGTLVTHARPQIVALGRTFGSAVFAVVIVAASLLITATALHLRLTVRLAMATASTMPLATVSAAALGLVLSAALIRHREAGHVVDALVYPIFIAGGLLIPPNLLPRAVWDVGALIPLRAINGFGEAVTGARPGAAAGDLLQTLGTAAAYLLVGWCLLTWQVGKVRAA